MKKKTETTADVWNDRPVEEVLDSITAPNTTPDKIEEFAAQLSEESFYDIDGLMTDFPTARELERFVFDETGHVLNLKGRANKMKYQIAMDALNGREIDPKFIGNENPYLDKNDLVPEEPMRPVPSRDISLPPATDMQNAFHSRFVPHPDAECRSRDMKVDVTFRKYLNGMITYEVIGPIEPRPMGEKIDKFGRTRPEIIKWVDPRTGEQLIVRADGSLTPMGQRLRALMQTLKVWDHWIDREFVSLNQAVIDNPWG